MLSISLTLPTAGQVDQAPNEPSIDTSGLDFSLAGSSLLIVPSSTLTSSTTLPLAASLPGPCSGAPMLTTLPPEQLCQIAGAVANILRHPLATTPPSSISVPVTESSEGTGV